MSARSSFWEEATDKPALSGGLRALLQDVEGPEMVEDVFVYDGGIITRSVTPRTSPERRRVQYHDCRSPKGKDHRTAKEIANA